MAYPKRTPSNNYLPFYLFTVFSLDLHHYKIFQWFPLSTEPSRDCKVYLCTVLNPHSATLYLGTLLIGCYGRALAPATFCLCSDALLQQQPAQSALLAQSPQRKCSEGFAFLGAAVGALSSCKVLALLGAQGESCYFPTVAWWEKAQAVLQFLGSAQDQCTCSACFLPGLGNAEAGRGADFMASLQHRAGLAWRTAALPDEHSITLSIFMWAFMYFVSASTILGVLDFSWLLHKALVQGGRVSDCAIVGVHGQHFGNCQSSSAGTVPI